ncbi:carbonic anhydrase [Nocardioides sp. SR21]|uniref:carbonic anhydrase n=1 Tax=Nocardioides sp. SR21 TaxID=2919501 RepID=UPI001FA9A3D9|nr:carbonic anhydrase family protein [Nocardioides sp. SR21]
MSSARWVALGCCALLASLVTGCSGDESEGTDSSAHDWSYTDVDAWGDTCASGDEQSPVDLEDAAETDLVDLELDYRTSPATVVDNGHTVQTNLEDGGTMTRDGVTYTLRQFHFHTPSEHVVGGAAYAAEVHLVHEGEDGELAVLGILVEEGEADPVIEDVLAHAPEEGADAVATAEPVDVTSLLPDGRRTFRYDGSLTTPPCSEGVAWSVLDEPMDWSAEQIAAFAELHPDSHRPPQPLGDRVLDLDRD